MIFSGTRRMGAMIAIATVMTSTVAIAEGTRLTGDALKQAIVGKTFTGSTSSGKTWESTYKEGGSYAVEVLDSDWSDTGTWEINADEVCSERTKRSRMCYQILKVDPGEFHWVDERRQTTKSTYAR